MRVGGILIGLCVLACISCVDYTPKPRGYMRIEPAEARYVRLDDKDLPFEFRVSDATVVELSDSGRVQRLVGVNILYPELGAKLYCSYFPVTPASLRIADAECRSFVARQAKPTDRIAEKAYSNPDAEVYASLFLIEGESASPIQFMLTDSASRFFRAALYFNCKPNADSLAPAVAYIRRDIVELIQSFSWRE